MADLEKGGVVSVAGGALTLLVVFGLTRLQSTSSGGSTVAYPVTPLLTARRTPLPFIAPRPPVLSMSRHLPSTVLRLPVTPSCPPLHAKPVVKIPALPAFVVVAVIAVAAVMAALAAATRKTGQLYLSMAGAMGKKPAWEEFSFVAGPDGVQPAFNPDQVYMAEAQKAFEEDPTHEGFYIAPVLHARILSHLARNCLSPARRLPLLLGIWGEKGEGKTLQTDLVFRKLGVVPVAISAGDLTADAEAHPAQLLRQRYRDAARRLALGEVTALFINDLDACGDPDLISTALRHIAIDPTHVVLPGEVAEPPMPRVPIVVTSTGFPAQYDVLAREGRMEKIYWRPTREDRIGICRGILADAALEDDDLEQLVDAFPAQPLSFFRALRSRVYDDVLLEFVEQTGVPNLSATLVAVPEPVTCALPALTLPRLLRFGRALEAEWRSNDHDAAEE